jgi:hypothetical protein
MKFLSKDGGKDSGQKLTDVLYPSAAGPWNSSQAGATIRARSTHRPSHRPHGHRGVYETPHALPGVTPCQFSERSVRLGRLLTCSLVNGRCQNSSDFSRRPRSVSF